LVGFAPIVYLALSGGGYDIIVRSELGLVACWAVLLGVLVGVLPRAGLTRASWIAVVLLGASLAWTWIATGWSFSAERTLVEVARIATYLGVLLVGLCVVTGGRARSSLNGVASAIATVAGLALLYRLAPSIFPADTGARFYYVTRLQWPFEYADAVGEFVALSLPLLVAAGALARTLPGRTAAAAGFVFAAVCLGLTSSQGGLLAALVGLLVLGLLWPWRISAKTRRAIALSLASAVMLAIVLVVATGVAQHAWDAFKRPQIQGQLSISGSHRYQYWQAAFHAFRSEPWRGIGPGTFQFYWAQHNSLKEFVLNAHSLYFETLAELGIVGALLIVCLFVTVLAAGIWRAIRSKSTERITVAAAVAGFAAFCAAAAFDWVWQIGAIPMVALLLAAIALNATNENGTSLHPPLGRARTVSRSVLGLASLVGLVAILVPLSETVAVRKSQAAAASGRYQDALGDAATAQRLEPGSAITWLQRALILEQLKRPRSSLAAVLQAQTREPANWRIWLIASRVATEAGRPQQALSDYRRARSLNPSSPLFSETRRLIPIGGDPLAALVVPPGKAGANQYFETIPGVAGNFAPPQAGRVTTRLNSRSLTALGRGQRAAQVLVRLSGGGEAAARLAAATAWPLARPAGATAAVTEARRAFDPPGSSPITAVAETVGGSDEGGLGWGLPVVLAAVLVGAVWVGVRRKRA
jgi:tetratricopeptide (TPR) repeat protein